MKTTILIGVAAAVGLYLLSKARPAASATVKTAGGASVRVTAQPDLSAYVGLYRVAQTPGGMVQTVGDVPASVPDLTIYGYG